MLIQHGGIFQDTKGDKTKPRLSRLGTTSKILCDSMVIASWLESHHSYGDSSWLEHTPSILEWQISSSYRIRKLKKRDLCSLIRPVHIVSSTWGLYIRKLSSMLNKSTRVATQQVLNVHKSSCSVSFLRVMTREGRILADVRITAFGLRLRAYLIYYWKNT